MTFHFLPITGFLTEFITKAQYEILREDAWDLSADENTIIKEAKLRHAAGGWDNVRPAISTTVR